MPPHNSTDLIYGLITLSIILLSCFGMWIKNAKEIHKDNENF